MVMEENRQFGYLNPCTDDTVIRQKSGQVVAGGAIASDKSTKQRIIIVVTALVGIFARSVIPFGTIINVLYPFAGCIGVVLFAIVIVNDFVRWRRGKKALPQV